MTWLYDRMTWLVAPWRDLSDMQAQLVRLQWKTDLLEESLMARVDELRERLAAATDELARDLDGLRARLADQDAALAAELEPMVARLEAMGVDPQNPVPDAPVDGDAAAPADVVNPTPGAQDNPGA